MAKSDETMTNDNMGVAADADTASTSDSPANTEEARQLAVDLARSIFLAMQKTDSEEAVDQRSEEFKEKWTAERPRMLKISRFALRRLFGKGYQFSSTSPDA